MEDSTKIAKITAALQTAMADYALISSRMAELTATRELSRKNIIAALNELGIKEYIVDDGNNKVLKAQRTESTTTQYDSAYAKEVLAHDIFAKVTVPVIDKDKLEALVLLKKIRPATVERFSYKHTIERLTVSYVKRPKS